MIRRFVVADGDNNPVVTRLSFTTSASGDGTQTISTAYPVSWAIVNGTDVNSDTYKGPFFYTPTGATTYNINTITGFDYETDTLLVYLNGALLTESVEYQEDGDNQNFSFIDVGTTGLASLPDGDDQLSFVFRPNVTALGSNTNVYVSSLYPDVSTGLVLTYENAPGSTEIFVDLIYR